MSPNTITEIALEQLSESPFNPRQIYAGLEELAANILAEGRIHEPLLVRPIVPPLFTGDPDATAGYEIVFGHRRLRAAGLAGLATVPCMVRAMDDKEARSAQVAENLQRADVHPFEEAAAFRAMIDAGDATADQLAERFGCSRAYVYGRMKLLQACPQVRDACLAGSIGSEVALLLARLRTDKLQAKALGYIAGKYLKLEDGGAESYRRVRDLLNEKFTLQLKGALFDPADAGLLPEAGACDACPKRAGNAPEYLDVAGGKKLPDYSRGHHGADVCTDPDCFDAKKKAHLQRAAAALEAKGKTVVAGHAARAAVNAGGDITGAYVALKDVRALLKVSSVKGKAAITPPALVTIQDPRSGKTFEAVKRSDAEAAGVKLKPTPKKHAPTDYAAQQREREARHAETKRKCEAETERRMALLQRVRGHIAQQARSAFDLGLVVRVAVAGVQWVDKPALASLWGARSIDALEERLGSMSVADLTRVLLDCALVEGVRCDHDGVLSRRPQALDQAAKHYGVAIDEPADTPSSAARAPKQAPAKKAKAKKVKDNAGVAGEATAPAELSLAAVEAP